MRVMLITGSFPPMPCGVGSYTLNLARQLADTPGIEVAVLTSREVEGESAIANVTVLPVMNGWRFREIGCLVRTIRAWNPDIIHVQYPTQGYGHARLPVFIPLIARLFGRIAISTLHEPYDLRGLPRFLVQSWSSAKSIVVRPNYEALLSRLARVLSPSRHRTFIPSASSIPRSVADAVALDTLRQNFLADRQRLLVFFGFLNDQKGSDLLFDIGNPATDHIVFVGPGDPADQCLERLVARAAESPWAGYVSFAGFLAENACADLIAAADAVVLPFRSGGGVWNSSIQAAVRQGTLVITTTAGTPGFDVARNVFSAAINDVESMRTMLGRYSGRKRHFDRHIDRDEWHEIINAHLAVYFPIQQSWFDRRRRCRTKVAA